ncbi:hypothetical protein EYF80_003348 [Liparis tanakae]|uniref:Uncharacterized protein n=1 Tax=Liparis tanakae TaxID=230148 RepID=A0A4Z2JA82_9TELE|nr:hypothetical protein EYF80_003348 [Liparis tanakae]
MSVASCAILENKVRQLRRPRWRKPPTRSDPGPPELRPSSRLWERSWSQRGPAVSSASPSFCRRDRARGVSKPGRQWWKHWENWVHTSCSRDESSSRASSWLMRSTGVRGQPSDPEAKCPLLVVGQLTTGSQKADNNNNNNNNNHNNIQFNRERIATSLQGKRGHDRREEGETRQQKRTEPRMKPRRCAGSYEENRQRALMTDALQEDTDRERDGGVRPCVEKPSARRSELPSADTAKASSVPVCPDETTTTRISGLWGYAPPLLENSPMVCSHVTATKPNGENEPIRSHSATAAAKCSG